MIKFNAFTAYAIKLHDINYLNHLTGFILCMTDSKIVLVDDNTPDPAFVYVIEYSLHYGLLKLSPAMRREFGISVMLIQV